MASTRRRLIAVLLASSLFGCGGDSGGSSATPDDGADSFNLSSAVSLMQLCLESYQMLTDFENNRAFAVPAPYTLQKQFYTEEDFSGNGLNGMVPIAFVATSGSAIYVVFRGTQTISEWISDAQFSQVAYTYVANGGKTETGFTGIYESIRTRIIQEVTSLAGGGLYTALYITGHSLGGALAILAAPDLAAQTSFKQPIVYTFAGPRAGDPTFAAVYNGIRASWRVVNTNDAAPKVPPPVTTVIGPPPEFKSELFFYEHVASEYDITFGEPISGVSDVIFNHSSCNYFATLCGETSNPMQCKQMGQGLNGCTFS